jgi:methyl-accepting chemotaxis protein
MNRIKESTESAIQMSTSLTESQHDLTEALGHIRENIENVGLKTNALDQEISKSDQISQEISQYSQNVRDRLTEQSKSADKTSSDIQLMVDNVVNVADITKEKKRTVNELQLLAASGQKEMEDTISIIGKISDSTEVVMDAVTMINNIAGKLDTLAINAAIEAAQAREAGKGFAVVAEEIRNMAEDTILNSAQITDSLKEVIDSIHISQNSAVKTGDYLNSIINGIQEVTASMNRIEEIMISLSSKSKDILYTFFALIDSTVFVKKAAQEMIEKIDGNYAILKNVKTISGQTAKGMTNITVLSNEIYEAIKILDTVGMNNSENINVIRTLVNKFKS